MAIPFANILGSAALSAATPYLSKTLRGILGGTEADRERQAAMTELDRVAQGGTTQGQAGLAYARGRALSDLEAQANKGTAQQQAGMRREAMGRNVEAQQQYAAQLAELRAREQERARESAAYLRQQAAREQDIMARRSAAGFMEGALKPIIGSMLTPDKEGGTTTPGSKRAEVLAGAAPRPAAARTMPRVRMAGAQVTPVDPFAEVSEPTLKGEIDNQFGLALAGGPQVAESRPMQDLASLQGAIGEAAKESLATAGSYEPFAYGFTPEEQVSPSLATGSGTKPSIYADMYSSPLGAAVGPDMAPAPIAMAATTPGEAARNIMAKTPKAPMPVLPTRRKAVVAPKARKVRPIDFEID